MDDDAANRKLLATLLADEKHQVFQAADGVEALALVERERPRLVISDILMPTMDGYEFVRRLRSLPQVAATEVIFYSAHYLESEARHLASACGVTRVLVKPCESEDILAAVRQSLDPAAQPPPPVDFAATGVFAHEHVQLMTNKLSQQVQQLSREMAERERATEHIRHLNRVYAVLSGINALIVRVSSRQELFKEACRLAVEQGHFCFAWIGWIDAASGELEPVAWSGDDESFIQVARAFGDGAAARANGLVMRACATQCATVCNDIGAEAATLPFGPDMLARGYRSTATLPLIIAGKTVGCLALYTGEAGFFDAAEMKLLNDLAGDIGFALDHLEKTARLDYLAYYDALTGFANRTLFHERLAQFVAAAGRSGRKLALAVVSLERFESITDMLGRHVADTLLRQVAERLIACFGNVDHVARIRTDQFAVAIPEVADEAVVGRAFDDWWRQWFAAPFFSDSGEFRVSSRAGIALYPDDGGNADALLNNAETALNKARATGDRHLFYTQQLSERVAADLALESRLRQALEAGEFVLHYQPKVDTATRRLAGVEALARWQHPERGLVGPNEFIAVMEEIGMIGEFGQWALHQACLDRSRWLEKGLNAPRVAVNVSTVQLHRADFVCNLADKLKLAGTAGGLDIEVTESLIMDDVAANIEKLIAVRDLGVGIAIDDFGTGYSSLGYLAKLPVETLKIDRSFTQSMLNDPKAMMLVSTMISLAHSLKLTVVAEGVETEEQAKVLQLLSCDQMQGYLISKPLPFEEMTARLSRASIGGPAQPSGTFSANDEDSFLDFLHDLEGVKVEKDGQAARVKTDPPRQ